ncbi:MAG: DNA-3-methyladenine glycosylase I [Clostridia bacterium]|nr:DNA-3-methyladenine glycosylase I [Clostridia bacterium]
MHKCDWCLGDEVYEKYHDEVWGVPVHEDTKLFEFLTLEGAQAGLSWITVLKKQAGYKKAFLNYDLEAIVEMTEEDLEALKENGDIIKNRLKIYSVVKNAKAVLQIQKEFGSFNDYLWGFVNHKPIIHYYETLEALPSSDEISEALSKDLKKRGCSFVGPTIMYAFMQAVGMVNDHLTSCFRHCEII